MIDQWMQENYPEIVKMSKRICKCIEYEELAHFAIEQFLNHKRVEELIESNDAMKFMSGIIWRSFNSNTSPYYTLYHQKGKVHELYDKTVKYLINVEYDFETDRVIEAIEGILEEMLIGDSNEWYRATLFKMYLETPNYSKLSRNTNIPRTSISNAVNECKEYVLIELKNRRII